MTYSTTLTIKGTTTIPAAIRKELGLQPGMKIQFEQDTKTGNFFIKRSLSIEEVRAMNQDYMKEHSMQPLTDEEIAKVKATAWAT